MKPLLIVRRSSPQWSSITREEYRAGSRDFCAFIGRPPEQMNELVDLWDATFRISYFATRQKMKEIAEAALANVQDVVFCELEAFTTGDWFAVSFVDDDDWFAPSLAEHLRFPPPWDGVVWTHVAMGLTADPLHRWPAGESEWLCYTNNYAVSTAYVQAHGIEEVAQHWMADRAFRSLRVQTIPQPLSVANKHPASAVFLERKLGSAHTSTKLEEVVTEFVRGISRIDDADLLDIEWARRHIEATASHFNEVLRSAY